MGSLRLEWDLVLEDHGGLRRVERLEVPGGYLYELRLYTLAEGETEPALCHASIVFVRSDAYH